jgi:UDP-2,3-diacylglucosamine hydrolase
VSAAPAAANAAAAAGATTTAPLGVIAGGGELPIRVARAAAAAGREVVVIALGGHADPEPFRPVPAIAMRLGAVGQMLETLRARGVRQLVLAGRVKRPSVLALRPDAGAARLLARIGARAFGGDDTLLSALVEVLREEGFEVLGAQDVLADILPPPGLMTRRAPDAQAMADIRRGLAVVRALGAVDVGQAAVVQQGLVLGVEAIEGTDALLARCAGLAREGAGGVLVKRAKPGQSRLADLPTVGIATVRGARAAGLRGIAVEAGGTIMMDRPAIVAAADDEGLFLVALDPAEMDGETTG